MRTTRLRRATTFTAALAIALTLAACAPDDETAPAPTTDAAVDITETVYDECVDGVATILADGLDAPFELGDCAAVSVVGVGGEITLGVVETLVLEGDDNTVGVAEVGQVAFGGNGNSVEHGGDAPQVVDDGDDNTVSARD